MYLKNKEAKSTYLVIADNKKLLVKCIGRGQLCDGDIALYERTGVLTPVYLSNRKLYIYDKKSGTLAAKSYIFAANIEVYKIGHTDKTDMKEIIQDICEAEKAAYDCAIGDLVLYRQKTDYVVMHENYGLCIGQNKVYDKLFDGNLLYMIKVFDFTEELYQIRELLMKEYAARLKLELAGTRGEAKHYLGIYTSRSREYIYIMDYEGKSYYLSISGRVTESLFYNYNSLNCMCSVVTRLPKNLAYEGELAVNRDDVIRKVFKKKTGLDY